MPSCLLLTHAGIEALKQIKEEYNIQADQVEKVEQFVPKTHFTV